MNPSLGRHRKCAASGREPKIQPNEPTMADDDRPTRMRSGRRLGLGSRRVCKGRQRGGSDRCVGRAAGRSASHHRFDLTPCGRKNRRNTATVWPLQSSQWDGGREKPARCGSRGGGEAFREWMTMPANCGGRSLRAAWNAIKDGKAARRVRERRRRRHLHSAHAQSR